MNQERYIDFEVEIISQDYRHNKQFKDLRQFVRMKIGNKAKFEG